MFNIRNLRLGNTVNSIIQRETWFVFLVYIILSFLYKYSPTKLKVQMFILNSYNTFCARVHSRTRLARFAHALKDSRTVIAFQGVGRSGWTGGARRIFVAVKILCDTILMDILIQTHRMYNSESECWSKLWTLGCYNVSM